MVLTSVWLVYYSGRKLYRQNCRDFDHLNHILLNPVYTIQPVVQPVVQSVVQPGKCLYTMQPVVQPVVQPAASCIQTFFCWTNRLYNRLYEFNMFGVNSTKVNILTLSY